jgi:hypothetical protein
MFSLSLESHYCEEGIIPHFAGAAQRRWNIVAGFHSHYCAKDMS